MAESISRASAARPWLRRRRARLTAARSSQERACCDWATAMACRKEHMACRKEHSACRKGHSAWRKQASASSAGARHSGLVGFLPCQGRREAFAAETGFGGPRASRLRAWAVPDFSVAGACLRRGRHHLGFLPHQPTHESLQIRRYRGEERLQAHLGQAAVTGIA
jgi:hypothetical protein